MTVYLENKKFKTLIIEWLATDSSTPMSVELCLAFQKIINKIATRSNFRGYTDLEDMKQNAFLNILKYGRNFNADKFNPFSYYTTMIFNDFVKYINKENKLKKDKIKMLVDNTEDLKSLQHYYNLDDL